MSLTAFQRYRRMQQVEAMKPENIKKEEQEEKPVEEPQMEEKPVEVEQVEENTEEQEEKPVRGRGRKKQ